MTNLFLLTGGVLVAMAVHDYYQYRRFKVKTGLIFSFVSLLLALLNFMAYIKG